VPAAAKRPTRSGSRNLIAQPSAAEDSVDRRRGSRPPRQRRRGSARGDAVEPVPLRSAFQACAVRPGSVIGASLHRSAVGFSGCDCCSPCHRSQQDEFQVRPKARAALSSSARASGDRLRPRGPRSRQHRPREFSTNGSGPQPCTAPFDATHSSGNWRGAVSLLRPDRSDQSTLNAHRERASTSQIKEPTSAAGQTFAILIQIASHHSL
jgi:hypothetical protein